MPVDHCCCKREVEYDVVLKNGRVISTTEDVEGPVFDKRTNVGIRCGKIEAITNKNIRGVEEIDCTGLVVSPGFVDVHVHGTAIKSMQYGLARDGVTLHGDLELGGLDLDCHYKEFQRRGTLINYCESSGNAFVFALVYGGMRQTKLVNPMSPTRYSFGTTASTDRINAPFPFPNGPTGPGADVWNADVDINNIDIDGLLTTTLFSTSYKYPGGFNTDTFLDAFLTYFTGDNPSLAPNAILTPDEEIVYFRVLEWGLQNGGCGIGFLGYNANLYAVGPNGESWNDLRATYANGNGPSVFDQGAVLTEFAKKHIDLSLKYNCTMWTHASLNSAAGFPGLSTVRVWLKYIQDNDLKKARFHVCHVSTMAGGSIDGDPELIETANLLEQMIDDGFAVTYEMYPWTIGNSSSNGFDLDQLLAVGTTYDDIFGSPVRVDVGGTGANIQAFESITLQEAAELTFGPAPTDMQIRSVWAEWQNPADVPNLGTIVTISIEGRSTQGNLDFLFKKPHCMNASDGIRSLSGGGSPARNGSQSRFLRQYTRDSQCLTLPEAIRKMTALPLKTLKGASTKFDCKGQIKEGYDADITVFDPTTVTENATIDQPKLFSTGIPHVLVNGKFVVRDEQIVENVYPGEIITGELKCPSSERLCMRSGYEIQYLQPDGVTGASEAIADLFVNCNEECCGPCNTGTSRSFVADEEMTQYLQEAHDSIVHSKFGCC